MVTPFYTLPFPPGKSPFKAKGTVYQKMALSPDIVACGGVEGLAERIPDPALKGFVTQTFLASSWYDIFPIPLITQYSIEGVGKEYNQGVRESGMLALEQDLKGVHNILLKFISPFAAAERLAIMAKVLLNFGGEATATRVDKRTAEVSWPGLPGLIMPWYGPTVEGYFVAALQRGGATGVKADLIWEPTDIEQDGIHLVNTVAKVSWA